MHLHSLVTFGKAFRQILQNGLQFGIGNLAQRIAQFNRGRTQHRRSRNARPCIRFLHKTLTHFDLCHRRITEKAVHPLYDFGNDMLQHRGMAAFDNQFERSTRLLASRKADHLGRGNRCVTRPDNFAPTADNRALYETEPTKSSTADIGHQIRNTARLPAARPLEQRRLHFRLFRRRGWLAFLHQRPIAFCMVAVQPLQQYSGDIAAALLAHYDMHARALPWRAMPGTCASDPYRVWLSEVMLQQTTVAAVIPYFEAFTSRWPDFAALASAEDADVMAAWAGLGYYSRARNLLKCARVVVADHGGRLPSSAVALEKLPGIGPYTAAAIAAIAFGERAIVVDANVERVASRLFAIATPLPAAKPAIRDAVDGITPANRPGDFAQAMMDLGAGICSPRAPQCLICPLSGPCMARAQGLAESLPRKAPKKAKPDRLGTAYWIERAGPHGREVWLARRPPHGMLGGMRALPDDRWSARVDGDSQPPFAARWSMAQESVVHVFTHFRLNLSIAVTASPVASDGLGDGEWWPVNSLDSAGLPTLFSKASSIAERAAQKIMEE